MGKALEGGGPQPRYSDAYVAELAETMSDEEIAEKLGYSVNHVALKRRSGGTVRDPNADRRLSPEDLAWVAERAEEGWPISEIIATRPHLRYHTLITRFPLGRNGNEFAAVKRWANVRCPDLLSSIHRMEI